MMNDNFKKSTVSFTTGYLLLLAVLEVYQVPQYGPFLALLLEAPVSGYYVSVMRHHINAEKIPEWTDLPAWDFSHPLITLRLGMALNAILTVYSAMALFLLAASGALILLAAQVVVSVSRLTWLADLTIGTGIAAVTLPILWCYAFILPLAIARFARTDRFLDAFNLIYLFGLAQRRSRIAALGATIFLVAVALNVPLTLITPQISAFTEPTIEFCSIVAAAVLYGRAFRRKVCAIERAELEGAEIESSFGQSDCLKCPGCNKISPCENHPNLYDADVP